MRLVFGIFSLLAFWFLSTLVMLILNFTTDQSIAVGTIISMVITCLLVIVDLLNDINKKSK